MGGPAPRVLVASDDLTLLDEIVRHLEEIPHWRLLSSARSAPELEAGIAGLAPDAVLISDGIAGDLARLMPAGSPPRPRVVVVGREERTETLRAALRLGARGFVRWPEDRREIRAHVEEGLDAGGHDPTPRAPLTVLWAPKGGAGASVLSAHLAGALAATGAQCLLADLDLDHGDQAAILGAEQETKSITDLLRVVDEISAGALDAVVWRHPSGFRVLLSRGLPGEGAIVKGRDLVRVLEAAREAEGLVVADVPSGDQELALLTAEVATRMLLVVTPDLLALRRARQAVAGLESAGVGGDRVGVVVNRFGDAAVTAAEVEAVVGRPVVAIVPPDLGLLRAPDRGRLADSGLRVLSDLAHRLMGRPAPPPPRWRKLLRR